MYTSTPNKPVFFHFFNPSCPCSKFNSKEFKAISESHSHEVDFVVVLQIEGQDDLKAFETEYGGWNFPVLIDSLGEISDRFGVYSTPQAVIMDESDRIFYKGNYNKSRFCTQPGTRFAYQALNALLNHQPRPDFGPLAAVAYGCSLPTDKKETETISLPAALAELVI